MPKDRYRYQRKHHKRDPEGWMIPCEGTWSNDQYPGWSRLAFFKFEIANFRDSFFFPEEEHAESSNWERSSWASCLGFFDLSKKRGVSESKSEISPGTDDCHSTSLCVLRGPLRRSGCNSGNVVLLRLTSWHIQFANSFRFFQWYKRSARVFRIYPVSLKCSSSVSVSGKWSE